MTFGGIGWRGITLILGIVACFSTVVAVEMQQPIEINNQIELPEMYRIRRADGFAIRYPAGWVIYEIEDELVFTNDATALTDEHEFPAAGQVIGSVSWIPPETYAQIGFSAADDLPEIFDIILEKLSADHLVEGRERRRFTINGKDGIYVVNRVTDQNRTADGMFILVDEEPGYSILIVLIARGEFDRFSDTVLAIAGSIETNQTRERLSRYVFTGIDELTQTITTRSSGFGIVTMRYPAEWVAEAIKPGVITFASDWETLYGESVIPDKGRVLGQYVFLPGDSIREVLSVEADSTPQAIIRAIVNQQTPESLETLTIRNHDAALVSISLVNDQMIASGIVLVVAETNGYSILSINTPHGQAAQYRSLLRAMAASLEFEAS